MGWEVGGGGVVDKLKGVEMREFIWAQTFQTDPFPLINSYLVNYGDQNEEKFSTNAAAAFKNICRLGCG